MGFNFIHLEEGSRRSVKQNHQRVAGHVIGSLCRTLLGLTFIFSGFVKAVDPLGTTYKIEDYLAAFSEHASFFHVFVPMAEVAAWALIVFEFMLGVLLLCNVWTKVTSWLSLLMMLVMTPLTLYIALTNPVSDCGCFGDALVLSNWATFWKNIVLLALVVVLLCTKRNIPKTFVTVVETCIACLALGIVLGMMIYARLHLPFIDFRPYKIGNNIPELMEIPEDAPMDEYEVKFVYENTQTGEQRSFTLENYPKADDTDWTFVSQESVLVKKGYEAPIHDFTILNYGDYDGAWDEEEAYQDTDLTDYVLYEEDREVTLAILYKVEKTNMDQAKRLNEMARDAHEVGTPFLLLTGSSDEEIERFREEAGYEYPIYFCDPVTLKTIVRANPGIVTLQNGTVVDKYNLRNR